MWTNSLKGPRSSRRAERVSDVRVTSSANQWMSGRSATEPSSTDVTPFSLFFLCNQWPQSNYLLPFRRHSERQQCRHVFRSVFIHTYIYLYIEASIWFLKTRVVMMLFLWEVERSVHPVQNLGFRVKMIVTEITVFIFHFSVSHIWDFLIDPPSLNLKTVYQQNLDLWNQTLSWLTGRCSSAQVPPPSPPLPHCFWTLHDATQRWQRSQLPPWDQALQIQNNQRWKLKGQW